MKIGKYISPSGETLNVIQVDQEGKRVEVDYGTHCHWWGEDEYKNWTSEEGEENLITEPEVETTLEELGKSDEHIKEMLAEESPETISEVEENPIIDEPLAKKRKRTPIKSVPKPKTKKKK